ncbi:MAG TPA: protease modulator HflC, partial [Verrucomicrobiae bacterium]|nr:protease modulator HflC [Verrucomicrobiae bacterium]
KILGDRERDLQQIKSEAYKEVQQIRGQADAKATEIYAEAYNKNKETAGFYDFMKTLDTYKQIATNDTTIVFSTDSDLFRFLKGIEPLEKNRQADVP